MKKTKIVATIGPKTADPKKLREMFKAGMSVARLNGSHNSLDWHRNTILLLKKTLPDCPILLDIPGKKLELSDWLMNQLLNKMMLLLLLLLRFYWKKSFHY